MALTLLTWNNVFFWQASGKKIFWEGPHWPSGPDDAGPTGPVEVFSDLILLLLCLLNKGEILFYLERIINLRDHFHSFIHKSLKSSGDYQRQPRGYHWFSLWYHWAEKGIVTGAWKSRGCVDLSLELLRFRLGFITNPNACHFMIIFWNNGTI